MTIDEAIERYTRNAEYERAHENLQGCLDFRQPAEWLKDYKKLLGAIENIKAEIQTLRGCSCSCSDGIIDDVEDIIDKYTSGKEEE